MKPPTRLIGTLIGTVAGLLVAALTLAPAAPAQARAAVTMEGATTYTCSSSFGTGPTTVGARVALPEQVRSGRKVASRRVTVAVVVPDSLADQLRAYGVEAVSGTAPTTRLRIGSERVDLTGLRLPRTALPADGPVTLQGRATLAAFTLRGPGRYVVRVPAKVAPTLVGHRDGQSTSADFACQVARDARTRLGTITVVR